MGAELVGEKDRLAKCTGGLDLEQTMRVCESVRQQVTHCDSIPATTTTDLLRRHVPPVNRFPAALRKLLEIARHHVSISCIGFVGVDPNLGTEKVKMVRQRKHTY